MDNDEIVKVEKCERIEIYKECPKCGKQNEIFANFCSTDGCETDLTLHPIKFQMKIFLLIPLDQKFAKNLVFLFNNEPTHCYQERSYVSGPRLSPIMGMTCNDFMELANYHGFETMIYLLSKFFYNSYFRMSRGYDRLLRINLLEGSKLHFLNWLSMQNEYGFNYEIIISEIINFYYPISDEGKEVEETENKKYYIKFPPKFFEKNTKIFGDSPDHTDTNIYDIFSDLDNEEPASNESDNPSLSIESNLTECEVYG